MVASTLTSKGQTTIPIEIRTYLNLKPGDKMEFLVRDGRVTIIPKNLDIRDLRGMLPKPKKPVSIEDMNKAIGKHLARKFRK